MDISIIIPLYKGKKYINKLLEMINKNILFNDLYRNCEIEIVFVNDYPEETIIINNAMLFDIRIVSQEKNMGIQSSRIEGIKVARGNYVIMLDQDDLVEDNWLFSQWDAIKKAEGTYCVCNGWNNRFKKLWRIENFQNQVNDVRYYLSQRNPIRSPGQVIIRKEAIPEEWLEYALKENGADDFLLWILALKNGNNFVINEDMLFYHTPDRSEDSITSWKMLNSLKETMAILRKTKVLSKEEDDELEKQIFRLSCLHDDRVEDIFLDVDAKNVLRLNEYKRVRDLSNVYHLWVQIKNRGLSIGEYLKSIGVSSVAIYGMGMIGSDLYEDLKREKIEVVYAIDQMALDYKRQLKIYHIEDDLEKVDLTIVTVLGNERKLIELVNKKTGGEAVSLMELLTRIASNEKCL